MKDLEPLATTPPWEFHPGNYPTNVGHTGLFTQRGTFSFKSFKNKHSHWKGAGEITKSGMGPSGWKGASIGEGSTNEKKGKKRINLNHLAHVADTLSVKKPTPRGTADRGDATTNHQHHWPPATKKGGN